MSLQRGLQNGAVGTPPAASGCWQIEHVESKSMKNSGFSRCNIAYGRTLACVVYRPPPLVEGPKVESHLRNYARAPARTDDSVPVTTQVVAAECGGITGEKQS